MVRVSNPNRNPNPNPNPNPGLRLGLGLGKKSAVDLICLVAGFVRRIGGLCLQQNQVRRIKLADFVRLLPLVDKVRQLAD